MGTSAYIYLVILWLIFIYLSNTLALCNLLCFFREKQFLGCSNNNLNLTAIHGCFLNTALDILHTYNFKN